jgi:pimeloyl-ACP methyl ester carboxylesterase
VEVRWTPILNSEGCSIAGIDLLPQSGQHLVRSSSRPRQEVVVGYWREVLDRSAEGLNRMITETLATLREADLPYLIVSGSEPQPGYREWVQRAMPRTTVTVLPDSGHFPHVAHPDRFAECLASTGDWRK